MIIHIAAGETGKNGFNNRSNTLVVAEPNINNIASFFVQTEGTASTNDRGPNDDFGDGVGFAGNKAVNFDHNFILVLGPEVF